MAQEGNPSPRGAGEDTHLAPWARCPGCLRALQCCPTMPAVCSLSFPSLPLLELRADISGSPERGQDAQNNSFHGRRKMSLAELGAKQRARRTRAAPCRSRAPRGWALLAGFCCGWKRALAWLESSGCSAFSKRVCNVGSKRVLHCLWGHEARSLSPQVLLSVPWLPPCPRHPGGS